MMVFPLPTTTTPWVDTAYFPSRPYLAFIPAQTGSRRIADKAIRQFAGKPLLAHTIIAAQKSGIFSEIFVQSDSREYLDVATIYGAKAEEMGPRDPDAGDYENWMLPLMKRTARLFPYAVAILRVTSPFRSAASIVRAREILESNLNADSVRAITPTRSHPAKSWQIHQSHDTMYSYDTMYSVMPGILNGQPWHSRPTEQLPLVYVQTAGLEIVRAEAFWRTETISGHVIAPIILEGAEAIDLNTPEDWEYAEIVAARHPELLP